MKMLHYTALSYVLVAGLALLLNTLCVPALAQGDASVPVLSVATTDHPPTVDGVLEDPAWDDAAGFTGLIPIGADDLSEHETTVLVTYTDERLYVAYECHFDPSSQLQGGAYARDEGS
ncbi:MAG: hypothetical protein R6V19_14380, partial [Armatimonadota bacterium]